MEQLFWIIAPQRFPAVVFAPQPPPQSVSQPPVQVAEHAAALPVMKVSTPGSQPAVQVSHCVGYAPMQRPVVELTAHLLTQPLLTLGTWFDVRIPAPAASRPLPAHHEAQEVKTLPAMHLAGLFLVELQASCLKPASQPSQ